MHLLSQGNPFYEAPAAQFCADIIASKAMATFTHHEPQHSVTLFCDFVAKLLLFLKISTFQKYHL